MSARCDKCGNPVGNAFAGRIHYCFHDVRVAHNAEVASRPENNEGSAGETPNPQDPSTENDDGINVEDS